MFSDSNAFKDKRPYARCASIYYLRQASIKFDWERVRSLRGKILGK